MKILALDIASSTGWAVYDTTAHPSSIRCLTFHVTKDAPKGLSQAERRRFARDALITKLGAGLRNLRPDVVVIERPLDAIMDNARRGKRMPLIQIDDAPEQGSGANATTVLMLNQLFATACTMSALTVGPDKVIEVAPRTWQTLIKPFAGENTKQRSIAFCRSLRIELPPTKAAQVDAADAAVIAFWAAGHCQQIKMMQREQAA